jgi:hypothetical protein
VFVQPLPSELADRKARIIAAVKNIDAPMLTRVWQELEYPIDVCIVTRGAHIEHITSKKIYFFNCNDYIKVGPLVSYLNVYNNAKHYEKPCMYYVTIRGAKKRTTA